MVAPAYTLLLDSKLLIYAAQRQYRDRLTPWLGAISVPKASAITCVEVFGYHQMTLEVEAVLEEVFAPVSLLPVQMPVIQEAVRLRQQRRMGLGEAIIAATAFIHDLTLTTHNTADFAWIPGLRLIGALAGSGRS